MLNNPQIRLGYVILLLIKGFEVKSVILQKFGFFSPLHATRPVEPSFPFMMHGGNNILELSWPVAHRDDQGIHPVTTRGVPHCWLKNIVNQFNSPNRFQMT